jgi:DsbC/DsbD-like thiol-disulfide interchange protein
MLVLSPGVLSAAEPERVRVRLVADAEAVSTGSTLRVGVLFEMAPGWHVYWKNPGDSGLATDVQFKLPTGFDVGPVEWPVPIRFTQPGNLLAYGYEGEVLLAADVQVPDPRSGNELTVSASVSWLACKERCVLGSAELEEKLPLSAASVAGARAVFERWRGSLPQRQAPFTVSTTGGLAPGARIGELSVWLQWSRPSGTVEWFPDGGARLKVSAPRVQTRGNLTRIDAKLTRVGQGGTPADHLDSVVVAADKTGGRRGWELRVPINSDL